MKEPFRVVKWDWKSQPEWSEINFALIEIPSGGIIPVESGTDEFAVVVADIKTSQINAQAMYEHWRKKA